MIGGACSTYGVEETYIQGLGGETRGKESAWKTGLDGWIIVRWIFRKCDTGVRNEWSWLKLFVVGGNM